MPLKLTRRHGSPCWYMRGTIRGVRVDESTGVSDRDTADEIRIRRESAILERTIRGDAVSRTFAEAGLSYLRAGGERKHLAPILMHFGERTLLRDVGQAAIEACARKLKPSASPSTINRHIFTPISAVLHHAAGLEWCAVPVIKRPKQPKGRVRWITREEARRLHDVAAPHLKPILLFLLSTGARVSEALYLDWRQVDLSRGQVTFLHDESQDARTKSAESRSVPMHPAVVAALANLKHRQGAVFRKPIKGKKAKGATLEQRTYGAPYVRRVDGGGQLSTGWAAMCRRAGISNFTPHDCRHTWATWHYQENRDLGALMELGGWKSVEMVMRYAHANVGHLAAGIDALWGTSWGETNGEGAQVTASIHESRKA